CVLRCVSDTRKNKQVTNPNTYRPDKFGKPLWELPPPQKESALVERIAAMAEAELRQAYSLRQKQDRTEKLHAIRGKVLTDAAPDNSDTAQVNLVKSIFSDIEARIVRTQ